MLSEKQTETYFKQAVEELYKNDGYLFDPDHGLHEQTVSHRLAVYLERRFLKNKTFRTCNLSVDCEYNRNRDDCKKLYGPCMDCRESCRIKELKTPFVYDRRSYSDARDFVRSYPEGKPCDLSKVLPSFIIDALKKAFIDMDRRLRGFADAEAVLTAPETRTSSPVRIDRNERCVSVSVESLYPCGEGAGYAGGITSSATDGLRVASAIFKKYDNI